MLKISIYQMHIIPAEPQANRDRVSKWVSNEIEKAEKPDILILPELWTTGYRLEDLQEIAEVPEGETYKLLSELAQKYAINIVGGSIAVKVGEKIYNRALVFNRTGQLIYQYDKMHLVPMLNEPDFLTAGDKRARLFTLDGYRMGLIICYDLRFPELARSLALEGMDVLFVVAEWPEARFQHWEVLQQGRAIENQCFLVSCNTVGEDQGTIFAGCSKIINPWGDIIIEGTKNKEETITSLIDIKTVKSIRENVPVFESRVPHLY
ncbi:putative hydrolase [Bacillus sp. TS-2]|nr:putative hydrolase [Bacillus sp. TS-2]